MNPREKYAAACLGALTPILINLLVVDLRTSLADVHVIDGLSYGVRVLALCAAACLVVWLNQDENRPIKVFQLGIAAPAVLTTLINGAAVTSKPSSIAAPRTSFQLPAFVGTAVAQPASAPSAGVVKNCLIAQVPSAKEQFLKGLVGILPDNQWFVVVGSFGTAESAVVEAGQIQRQFGGRFQSAVCQPLGGVDNRYRVVIAENLSYADATNLKVDAMRAGLPEGTWVWNPFEMSKSIQR